MKLQPWILHEVGNSATLFYEKFILKSWFIFFPSLTSMLHVTSMTSLLFSTRVQRRKRWRQTLQAPYLSQFQASAWMYLYINNIILWLCGHIVKLPPNRRPSSKGSINDVDQCKRAVQVNIAQCKGHQAHRGYDSWTFRKAKDARGRTSLHSTCLCEQTCPYFPSQAGKPTLGTPLQLPLKCPRTHVFFTSRDVIFSWDSEKVIQPQRIGSSDSCLVWRITHAWWGMP